MVDSRCAAIIPVRPWLNAERFSTILRSLLASSDDVASSRNRILAYLFYIIRSAWDAYVTTAGY